MQFQTCKYVIRITANPVGSCNSVIILSLIPVKVSKEVICWNLISFWLHELVVVFSQTILVVTSIVISHGIVPRILDWMVYLSSIFLGIEHKLAHLFSKRFNQISSCFLVDEIAIIAIILGHIYQFTGNWEATICVLLQSFSEFFLICNTIRPVKEECTIYRNPVTVTCINNVRSWNKTFPEDH